MMDHKTKNMLTVAMEESAEIIQACSKSIRFGLSNHHPNRKTTNADEILTEFYQLQAVIEDLQRNRMLPTYNEDYIKNIKKNKLKKIEIYRKKYNK